MINWKTWQLRMHCNTRPPEPRQSLPALLRRHAKFEVAKPIQLPYYSVFAADTSLRCELHLWVWPVTLTFDLGHLQCIACHVMTLCTKFECNPAILRGVIRSYCDFSVWHNDREHCVTCCARLWDKFHEVLLSTTYPCLNYSRLMLIRYVTLWNEIWAKSSDPRLNYW